MWRQRWRGRHCKLEPTLHVWKDSIGETREKWRKETRKGSRQIKTKESKWLKWIEMVVKWKEDENRPREVCKHRGHRGMTELSISSLYSKLVLSDYSS